MKTLLQQSSLRSHRLPSHAVPYTSPAYGDILATSCPPPTYPNSFVHLLISSSNPLFNQVTIRDVNAPPEAKNGAALITPSAWFCDDLRH